jgi:hypothetical protein
MYKKLTILLLMFCINSFTACGIDLFKNAFLDKTTKSIVTDPTGKWDQGKWDQNNWGD